MRTAPARQLAATAAVLAVLAGCGAPDVEPGLEAQRERGAELYQRHCVECHGGATGGDISDIPPRHNAEGHTWHHGDCELIDITLEGMPQRPDYPQMPAFGHELDDDDVRAILAHIRTWWEPDQREHQAEATELLCD